MMDEGLEKHLQLVQRAKEDVNRYLRAQGTDSVPAGDWHDMIIARMNVLDPDRPKYMPLHPEPPRPEPRPQPVKEGKRRGKA